MNLVATLSVAAVALTAGLLTGTYYTARYKNYQLDSQRIAAMERAVKKEIEASKNIQKVSNDYDQQIVQLSAVIADTTDELGRLRVKRCPAVPKAATTLAAADATASGSADRDREIEIDLDRSAAEIIRLGGDLDRANEQIRGLQAVVKGYLTAASGD